MYWFDMYQKFASSLALVGIKSLSKQTKITSADISDGVTKRDGLGILKS